MAQFVTVKNPSSGTVSTVGLESRFVMVIEDIQSNYNRIFIDRQAYDVNTLTLLANTPNWHFNNRDTQTSVGVQIAGGYGALYLTKGAVSTYCSTETLLSNLPNGNYALRGVFNMYHSSIDPDTIARPMIKLQSNNIFYSNPASPFSGTVALTGTVILENYGHVYGPDITQSPVVTSGSYGITLSNFGRFGPMMLYEDATNGYLWSMGFAANNTTSGTQVLATNNYLTSSAPTVASIYSGGAGIETYFLGRDNPGNPYFVIVNRNTANEGISVFYANQTSRATTTSLANQVSATSNSQTYNMTMPSNVRVDSSTRKVFYTMHWDSSNNLAPLQFIWNPSVVGSISKVNCTINYPGTNTYSKYGAHYTNTAATAILAATTWHAKPYQFTIGATNYITFTVSDVGAGHLANATTRFSNNLLRTWITCTIGNPATSNDNILTYHSSYVANTVFDLSRNWMPVPGTNGNTLAVATAQAINFIQFDPTNGWELKSQYKGITTGFGFDQTNRMWAYMVDDYARGNPGSAGSIHIVTPTANTPMPTNISINFANNNLLYSGANISTTASVSAYDFANNRIEANVTLTIDGSSMVFDTGKTKTITTNTSGDVSVGLTIIGGGQSTIIPSVNI